MFQPSSESFSNKGFWMDKGSEFLSDPSSTCDDSSRIQTKRSQQWFLDAADSDIFPSKKRAVQAPNSKMSYEFPIANFSPWENASNFQSVPNHYIDRMFGSETARPIQYPSRDFSSVRAEDLNSSSQFEGDASIGLSISHAMEDRGASSIYGELRKVKHDHVENDPDIYNLRGHNSFRENNHDLTIEQLHSRKISSGFDSSRQAYKEDGGVTLMDHSCNRGDAHGKLLGLGFGKEDNIAMPIGGTYYKADHNIISFGGFPEEHDNVPFGRPIGSCDASYDQSLQVSGIPYEKVLDGSNASAVSSSSRTSKLKPETTAKSKSEFKTSKKEAPNSFPSNVRTLISTGMLDGVPVKYISLTREELRGIIKGSGYLCGCQSCNFSKVLNAYEFERHAGSKTKHPNNHIYFENGKTIYQIVQELRSTPQSCLFDTIQTVFGAPINQKSFRVWKESFQAATRELQRIYGKEELNL